MFYVVMSLTRKFVGLFGYFILFWNIFLMNIILRYSSRVQVPSAGRSYTNKGKEFLVNKLIRKGKISSTNIIILL